jgi:uncharacterized membrane protein
LRKPRYTVSGDKLKGMATKGNQRSAQRFIVSVASLCALAAVLLSVRIIQSDSSRYIFLYWNLALAILAPLIAFFLVYRVRRFGWLHPIQLLLTLVWLLFLPNSFYIISDFIHLRETYEAPLLYDIALFMSFVMSGLILGMVSVYVVHLELQKKIRIRYAWLCITAIFLLSSFAIYLGRFSRWNTWDILLAPAGLLFDVSDRVVNPAAHKETYVSTLSMFLLLLAVYWVLWEGGEYLRASKR